MENHLRVDSDERNVKKDDCETSIFIGNLPFIVREEELRAHFEECGEIKNVRVVRDPKTFLGKGIGYVQFATKEEMRAAIESKNTQKFRDRQLRIKKAVEPKRLEKKKNKKKAKIEQIMDDKKLAQAKGKNFESLYDSDDSDDAEEKVQERNRMKSFIENAK